MRKIDYELEIKGEKKTYKPRTEFVEPIIKSDNRIFEITADNSYGKTFILNLLAYALEAHKLDSERILKGLKESISRYDDETSYNLTYEIDLPLPDSKTLNLSKNEEGNKRIQINNGSPLGYQQLHNQLSIIYDVPTNPAERLNAVIKDLGQWNNKLKTKFESFARQFHQITRDFDNVKDETKIEDLNTKIKIENDKINSEEGRLKIIQQELDGLKIIDSLNNLAKLMKSESLKDQALFKTNKILKTIPKPQTVSRRNEKYITDLARELNQWESDFKSIVLELISHINQDDELKELFENDSTRKSAYELIKSSKIHELIEDSPELFLEKIENVKDDILRFIEEKRNDKKFVIHNSFEDLFKSINNFIDNKIGHILKEEVDIETEILIKKLNRILSDYQVKDYAPLKSFLIKDLKKLRGFIVQYFKTNKKYKDEQKKTQKQNSDEKYYSKLAQKQSLQKDIKDIKAQIKFEQSKCALKLEITDFSRIENLEQVNDIKKNLENKYTGKFNLDNLKLAIKDLDTELRKIKNKIKDYEDKKKLWEASLDIEQNKNEAIYNESQKANLKAFYQILLRINNNLNPFGNLIGKIERGDLSGFHGEEDQSFIELAGKIIAHSMDNKLLRADGVFINYDFYDMIKQEFHCENDVIIKKDDVSTGLASANYLKQRIDNVSGDYVIVLLDEIGNMAQNALNKVLESVKRLEENNRLVLAILTRPNSNGIQINEY